MAINDQIRDEKLQYDINREAAKISALSLSKICKYEYLTGDEILPSNQKQIIEQAKFTYSPLGKVFEEQIKAIQDQGEKQTTAIEDNKKQLTNINADDYKNRLLISKETEIFKNIYDERLNKIEELTKKINFEDLKYFTERSGMENDFNAKDNPITFLNSIKTNKVTIEEAKAS